MITGKHFIKKLYNHHRLYRPFTAYELTTIDCSATQYSGYRGDEVTLIDNPPAGYIFNSWSLTGSTVTGNNFKFINSDVTAKANYSEAPSPYTSIAIFNAVLGLSTTPSGLYYPDTHEDKFYYNSNLNFAINSNTTADERNLYVFAHGEAASDMVAKSAYSENFVTSTYGFARRYTDNYIKLTGSQSAVITSIQFDLSSHYDDDDVLDLDEVYFSAGDKKLSPVSAGGTSPKRPIKYRTDSYHEVNYYTYGSIIFDNPVILTAGQYQLPFKMMQMFPSDPITLHMTAGTAQWNGYISGMV